MGYFSADHVSENSTVLQISVEEFEKVCLNCRNAQLVILWLKSMNYVHVMTLHDATKVVQQDINRFKVRDDNDDNDDDEDDDDEDDDDNDDDVDDDDNDGDDGDDDDDNVDNDMDDNDDNDNNKKNKNYALPFHHNCNNPLHQPPHHHITSTIIIIILIIIIMTSHPL